MLGALAGALIVRFLTQPKLVYYLVHAASTPLRLPEAQNSAVNTHSILIRNIGRAPAHNVRLSHFILPPTFSLNPAVRYTREEVPDSGDDIVIPILARNEEVTVTYLYPASYNFSQVNARVRCDEGLGQVLSVLSVRQYPKWVNVTFRYLMLAGFVATLYLLIGIVRSAI